jgi:FkbM family methyltransferase
VCDGVRFPFWIANEHAASWWGDGEVRFDCEMEFLKRSCFTGATVLEVGAHHGMHTLQLARWVGSNGVVHALELNAANALALAANIGINRLPNVAVRHAAVGARSGWLQADGETISASGPKVAAVALDDYCERMKIGRVDMLKIDVEGYEWEVLRGAERLVRSRPAIDLELHVDELRRRGREPEEVVGPLLELDYEITRMIRPAWFSEQPLESLEELKGSAVVNLFFDPVERRTAAPPR